MNNNGCGQLGAIQTRGTCWFFSILNGFILSEDGQKILYMQLKKIYKNLKSSEKAYFDEDMNAPCPMKNITKTKEIYFWKFIDQYLCYVSGPRTISLQARKSASILGGMSLQGTVAKQAQGARGAYPQVEIGKILDHVGFKGDYYMQYADERKHFSRKRKPQFVVVSQSQTKPVTYMERLPTYHIADPDYEIMCASLVIANTNAPKATLHSWHAIAGFVCNGKGYIYDSNQRKVFKCDWWIFDEFVRVTNDEVGQFYPFFRGGKINYHAYAFATFARKEAIKDVAPACLLKTKVLKTPNFYGNLTDPNLGKRLNRGNFNNRFNPAQIAALKRKWGRTEHRVVTKIPLNRASYNSVLKTSTSRSNLVKKLLNLEDAGYIVNKNSEAFKIFESQARNKFAVKKTYTFTEAKAHLNQFTKSTAAVRKHQYSLVWKGIPLSRRKVLMHWRNKGEWLATNAFEEKAKSPIKKKPKNATPWTQRRDKVRTNFNTYWKGLHSENRKVVRNYIAAYKSPSPIKPKSPSPSPSPIKPKSPSPAKNSNALAAAKRNVNAFNTAKAREEWRKKHTAHLDINNWKAIRNYIKQKNADARMKRALKSAARKKV